MITCCRIDIPFKKLKNMKKCILTVIAIVNTVFLLSQDFVRDKIADTIDIQGSPVLISKLPRQLVLNDQLGLVTVPWINGQVIYKSDAANNHWVY